MKKNQKAEVKTRQNILNHIFIAIGTVCLIYSIIARGIRGSLANYFMLLGVMLISIGLLLHFFSDRYNSKKYRAIVKIVKSIIIFCIAIFIIIEGTIIYSANVKDDVKADYVIVLGAGLWGEIPSPILVERLDAALMYLEKYPNTKTILSGGMGAGETVTEAEAMERYLIQHGVKKELILKEEESTNTMENFKFTKELIEKYDNRENIKVQIVTNGFHMFRSKLLARRNGFTASGYPAKTYSVLIPAYYGRESLAVIKSVIFDR